MRCLAALIALALAGSASADEELSRARAFFDAGKRAYEAGQYKQAIAAFQESYALSPRPSTEFSLAQANRLQYFQDRDPAKLGRAIDLYRKYLADEPMGARRGDATEHLATLEPIWQRMADKDRASAQAPLEASTQLMVSSQIAGARGRVDGGAFAELPLVVSTTPGRHKVEVEADGYFPGSYDQVAVLGRLVMVDAQLAPRPARVRIDAPEGAAIALSGRPLGRAPLAPLSLPAGRYLLTVSETGSYPQQRELDVARGADASVSVELDRTTQRYVAYGIWGLATITAGVGSVSAAIALGKEASAKDIAESKRTKSLAELDRYESLLNGRENFANGAYALFSVAAGLGVTGALLYVFDDPRVEAGPESLELLPIVSPEGPGVSLRGRLP